MMILGEVSTNSFLIDLLEKGGLPALTTGVMFVIFFFWIRSQAKQQATREESTSNAFKELQTEREQARKREAEQYHELMDAYEDIVGKFIVLSVDTAKAITRLSERVGSCPLKIPTRVGQEIPLENFNDERE